MCGEAISGLFSNASFADIASTAGTVIQAGAQIQAGQQAKKALGTQADLIQRQGGLDLQALETEKRRTLARQKTGFAKSGVRRSGSVLEVMKQTAEEAEQEALNIQFGADAGSQARLFEGSQAAKAGKIGGVGTLLTGFGGR